MDYIDKLFKKVSAEYANGVVVDEYDITEFAKIRFNILANQYRNTVVFTIIKAVLVDNNKKEYLRLQAYFEGDAPVITILLKDETIKFRLNIHNPSSVGNYNKKYKNYIDCLSFIINFYSNFLSGKQTLLNLGVMVRLNSLDKLYENKIIGFNKNVSCSEVYRGESKSFIVDKKLCVEEYKNMFDMSIKNEKRFSLELYDKSTIIAVYLNYSLQSALRGNCDIVVKYINKGDNDFDIYWDLLLKSPYLMIGEF